MCHMAARSYSSVLYMMLESGCGLSPRCYDVQHVLWHGEAVTSISLYTAVILFSPDPGSRGAPLPHMQLATSEEKMRQYHQQYQIFYKKETTKTPVFATQLPHAGALASSHVNVLPVMTCAWKALL